MEENNKPFAASVDSAFPYSDIIHLPHHKSNRPHMSMYDRAAQFSPFAALVGFDGVIAETGRLTDRKIELSESDKILLDQKLTLIDDVIQDSNPCSKYHPESAEHHTEITERHSVIRDTYHPVIRETYHPVITVLHFVPDEFKDGGEYQTHTGKVRQIDTIARELVFLADNGRSAGVKIRIDDITEIHGELVDYMDE